MLGTPMVTFYRVNALSWYLQRWRVRTPFLTMVNLVAGRQVVPELIQDQMTRRADRLRGFEAVRGRGRDANACGGFGGGGKEAGERAGSDGNRGGLGGNREQRTLFD